jgi:uncharacterized metal-binding protein YceD (DUF177 family)
MKINLSKIPTSGIVVDEDVVLDKKLYENTDIIDIKSLHISGNINYDYENNLDINLVAEGIFILEDAITLEDIEYYFSCPIEEKISDVSVECENFYEKSKNTLDISEILWENIVLEIPIRATNSSSDEMSLSGDGWELVNENVKKIDPRLAKLTELLDGGKE